MKTSKQQLASSTLATLASLYLVLLGMEFLKPGLVSNIVDLNILLIVLIAFAIGGSALNIFPQHKQRSGSSKKIKFTAPVVIGILGVLVLGVKLSSLGPLGWMTALLGGITIGSVVYLSLNPST